MGCDMSDDEPSAGPLWPGDPVVFNKEMINRIQSKARHPSTPDPLALLEQVPEMKVTPLSVFVDVLELLEHFDSDEAKTFEFLGKLRDLLA